MLNHFTNDLFRPSSHSVIIFEIKKNNNRKLKSEHLSISISFNSSNEELFIYRRSDRYYKE